MYSILSSLYFKFILHNALILDIFIHIYYEAHVCGRVESGLTVYYRVDVVPYTVSRLRRPLHSAMLTKQALCLGHVNRPTVFVGRHLGVVCMFWSNHHREIFLSMWLVWNPWLPKRSAEVMGPSIGMLSADVCHASVGSPPPSTDEGPMFQPMGRRSADKYMMSVDCRWIVSRMSTRHRPTIPRLFNLSMSAGHRQMRKRYTNRHKFFDKII
jgi:hypothetical protein